MKHILTLSLCFLALSISVQVEGQCCDPEGCAVCLVAVPCLQYILAVYGNGFTPSEITFDNKSEYLSLVSINLRL